MQKIVSLTLFIYSSNAYPSGKHVHVSNCFKCQGKLIILLKDKAQPARYYALSRIELQSYKPFPDPVARWSTYQNSDGNEMPFINKGPIEY